MVKSHQESGEECIPLPAGQAKGKGKAKAESTSIAAAQAASEFRAMLAPSLTLLYMTACKLTRAVACMDADASRLAICTASRGGI